MEEVMSKRSASVATWFYAFKFFILTPFVLGLWTSSCRRQNITNQAACSALMFRLDNYVNAIEKHDNYHLLLNSLVISVLTTAFQLIFAQ